MAGLRYKTSLTLIIRLLAMFPFLLACSGILTTGKKRVSKDVKAYLDQRYSEPFIINHVNNNSNAGTGLIDSFTVNASPESDPSLVFKAWVSYEKNPTQFSDRYGCEKVGLWLRPLLEKRLEELHMRAGINALRCKDQPPPLPTGTAVNRAHWTWAPTVDVYTDGDWDQPVDLDALATELGIRLHKPTFLIYPRALEPLARRLPNAKHSAVQGHNLAPWLLGYINSKGTTRQAVHFTNIEKELLGKIDKPVQIHVRPRFNKVDSPDTAFDQLKGQVHVDVRMIGTEIWTEEAVLAFQKELRTLIPANPIDIRILDPLPEGALPSGPGWVCSWKCERVETNIGGPLDTSNVVSP